MTTWSYFTDEEGEPVSTTEDEEREYRAYAAVLGIDVETPAPAAPSWQVGMPVAEVERLRALAALKPDSEDELYDRYAKLAGVRR